MERKPQVFTPDQKKMHELIQYISQQCASQANYGKTKTYSPRLWLTT